ncbi:hypothetical protein C8J57DRAFT_357700 [Mycena rebaudengoi]|nr:hypothetical protein C8J57DRAFT_357700 [Mycena rebaudengoi]
MRRLHCPHNQHLEVLILLSLLLAALSFLLVLPIEHQTCARPVDFCPDRVDHGRELDALVSQARWCARERRRPWLVTLAATAHAPWPAALRRRPDDTWARPPRRARRRQADAGHGHGLVTLRDPGRPPPSPAARARGYIPPVRYSRADGASRMGSGSPCARLRGRVGRCAGDNAHPLLVVLETVSQHE